jgi:hypothetical protein
MLHIKYAWEAVDGANDIRDGVGDVRGGESLLLVRSLASPTC